MNIMQSPNTGPGGRDFGNKEPKTFSLQYNIGKAKYVVNYHNGMKTHADGSEFFDIAIFKNKQKLLKFTNELKQQGYKEN